MRRMAQQFHLTNRLRTEERGISWRPRPPSSCDASWRKVWRMPMTPLTQHQPAKMCRFGSILHDKFAPVIDALENTSTASANQAD